MTIASIRLSKVVPPGGRRSGALVGTWGPSSAPATHHHRTADDKEMSNTSKLDKVFILKKRTILTREKKVIAVIIRAVLRKETQHSDAS